MADGDESLGLDGTQPLPTAPVLPDPLAGLVTGALFVDPADILGPVTAPPPPPVTPTAGAPRRAPSGARRPTARTGATTPNAIPVAASLPSRPAQRQRAVARPTTAAAIAPVRGGSVAQTPSSRQASGRGAGAGCGVFLLIVVLLVAFFIVLGVVTHGGGGAGGFSGG